MGTRKGRKNEAFGFLSATEKSLWLPVCDRKKPLASCLRQKKAFGFLSATEKLFQC